MLPNKSEQFVGNHLKCASSFGLSKAEIDLEITNKKTKNIYCSNCLIIDFLGGMQRLECLLRHRIDLAISVCSRTRKLALLEKRSSKSWG